MVQIDPQTKANLKGILKKDSTFLKDQGLIDYSVFLLEIDRQKLIRQHDQFSTLVYDFLKKEYLMQESESAHTKAEIKEFVYKKKEQRRSNCWS